MNSTATLAKGLEPLGGEAPRTLVVRTAGTNCDAELCRAFELAGAAAELVHVDVLCREPKRVDGAAIIALPGGFSYGDDIASGRLLAARLRLKLWPALRAAVERRTPMIGVCNGFQVLAQLGLVPGGEAGAAIDDEAPEATVALANNAGGRFIDRWVEVEAPKESPCVWTKSLRASAGRTMFPIAHAEGRVVARSEAEVDAMGIAGRVALRYVDNPNGSMGDIAGLCDPSGLIFGLMPHPERFLDAARSPLARLDGSFNADGPTAGLMIFRDAIEYVARGAR